MTSTCRQAICSTPTAARGLCQRHYDRWRAGDSSIEPGPRVRAPGGLTHIELFGLTVTTATDSGCIEWQGHCSRYGYGIIQSKAHGAVGAHRVAYEIHSGVLVPRDMHVLHRCDNPPCVNPAHLFLGRDKQNVDDMVAKRRHRFGERVKRHKLSEDDIRVIRRRYAAGGIGRSALAKEFGVSASAIQKITERKMWRHVA